MKRDKQLPQFVLCIRDGGSVDLQVRKVYERLLDPLAARDG
jgi:hypothetical protein